jgi:hypothetical protein
MANEMRSMLGEVLFTIDNHLHLLQMGHEQFGLSDEDREGILEIQQRVDKMVEAMNRREGRTGYICHLARTKTDPAPAPPAAPEVPPAGQPASEGMRDMSEDYAFGYDWKKASDR